MIELAVASAAASAAFEKARNSQERHPLVWGLMGVFTVGMVFGTATGIAEAGANNAAHIPHLTTTTEATSGEVAVKSVDFSIPDERITGYFAHVTGSMVEMTATVANDNGIDADMPLSKSMSFEGDVLVQICQQATDLKIYYNENDHSAIATIPESAINNCAETDLLTRKFTPGNDILNVPVEGWTAAWKAAEKRFPGITSRIPFVPDAVAVKDGIDSKLQNLAQIKGEELAVKDCSAKVWESDIFRKTYRDRMADRVLMALSLDPKVVRDHITIYVGAENAENPDLPLQVFPHNTDYTAYLDTLENEGSLDIGSASINDGCKLAPGIENYSRTQNRNPSTDPTALPTMTPTGGEQ